jgi:uncharacterized caspase-like protein
MKSILFMCVLVLTFSFTGCNEVVDDSGISIPDQADNAKTGTYSIMSRSRYSPDDSSAHGWNKPPFQEPRGLGRVEKRYALVIGNAKYVGDPNIKPLKNPVNDARDMKKALEQVGFKVIYRENVPNRENMEKAVDEFTRNIENGGIGLFYYAGHGVQAYGINYLIPTKVSVPTQVELKHRAMPANFVLDKMEFARNDLNIIILDACRNNPLPTRGRDVVKGGLAEMRSPAGSILIYSTAPGERAYDGTGRNGVFTKHLLKGIKEHGYMQVEAMLKNVRMAVEQETLLEPVPQVPWQNSSLKRDFCFSQSGCIDPEAEKARYEAEKAKIQLEEERRRADKERRRANEERRRAEEARVNAEKAERRAKQEAAAAAEESTRQAKEATRQAEKAKRQAKEATRQAEKAKRQAEYERKRADKEKRLAKEAKRDAQKASAAPQQRSQKQQPAGMVPMTGF